MLRIVSALVVLVLYSPLPALAQEAPTDSDRRAIRQVLEEVRQVVLAGDAEALASLFTDDMLVARTTQPDIVGREEWRSLMSEVYAEETVTAIELASEDTIVLGDWAFDWGSYAETVVPADGEAFDVDGDYVMILKKEDDAWKIDRHMPNRDVLPRDLLTAIKAALPSAADELERNKALVRRAFEEVWSNGDLDAVDELFSHDFARHFPVDSPTTGLDSFRDRVSEHREAFPDWNEKVELIVAEGDMVAVHFSSSGTNHGSFQGNPPTGRRIGINEMSVFRIDDGRIAEQWLIPDLLSLYEQLGLRSR